jgi:hypothetical protein
MRITDNRYTGEQQKFDLAVRLIAHEARTHIIAGCTGFSQDRIRKLYATYFRHGGLPAVRRQRGKSPSNVSFFVRNARVQSEASALAGLFAVYGLIHISRKLETRLSNIPDRLVFGERFCEAFEAYLSLFPEALIPFEQAWNLLHALTVKQDILLADCRRCGGIYAQDALALDHGRCPPCRRLGRATAALDGIQ